MPTPRTTSEEAALASGTGGRRLFVLPLGGELFRREVVQKIVGKLAGASPPEAGGRAAALSGGHCGCCRHWDHFVPLRLMSYFSTRDLYLAA